jgi:hypothetical protein
MTAIELPLVMDDVNLAGIGINAARSVGDDGVGLPRAPELVADLHILLKALVATRAIGHFLAIGLPLAFGVGADDVPGDAPVRKVIETGEPPTHRVGML